MKKWVVDYQWLAQAPPHLVPLLRKCHWKGKNDRLEACPTLLADGTPRMGSRISRREDCSGGCSPQGSRHKSLLATKNEKTAVVIVPLAGKVGQASSPSLFLFSWHFHSGGPG
jgi:hypothetical protein